jgi:dihydroorotate dehydrogenase (NAD+) catalytic subunit
MSAVTLSVDVGPLRLRNPILLASGTCGYGLEMAPWVPLDAIGGIVTKSLSPRPRPGGPPPRVAELPTGMLNAIGLENIGLDAFLEQKLPALRERGATVIVSIFAETEDEFVAMVERLDGVEGVAAIELNISCPNVKAGGMEFGTSPAMTERLLRLLRARTRLPLIAKLTPNDTNIFDVGAAALQGGADILSLVNTFLGMAVDVRRERPLLANVVGGYSGPGIKPIALRMVYEMVRRTGAPVIGIGGIQTVEDVLEFLFVGARAVQLGTVNFRDPTAAGRIVQELAQFLADRGLTSVDTWIGRIARVVSGTPVHWGSG